MSVVILLARIFVTATFLLSGVLKLIDPSGFLIDVQAFDLFPYGVAYFLSLWVPVLEIICSLGIWRVSFRNASAAILSIMTVGFILLIGYEEWQGLNLNCGCFGDWLFFPNFYTHIGFNCILLAALLLNMEKSHANKNA
jgi:putative oxidoreductase